MSFLNSLGNSKYLKKEDAVPQPLLLTITGCEEENVMMENEPEKFKKVLYFAESDKGFVLGPTTGGQIASFLGDPGDDVTKWFGKKIVLFCDKTVMMGHKLVGGLRVREPRNQGRGPQQPPAQQRQQAAPPAQIGQRQPPPIEPDEDNIPY